MIQRNLHCTANSIEDEYDVKSLCHFYSNNVMFIPLIKWTF